MFYYTYSPYIRYFNRKGILEKESDISGLCNFFT